MNSSQNTFVQTILEAEKFLILTHVRPDGDAISSSISMYYFLLSKGKDAGKIDVVIAKDLSRIGRNNGKVLVLIDEFKNMQKNLILVSEMGGSYDVLNDRDDTIGINWNKTRQKRR